MRLEYEPASKPLHYSQWWKLQPVVAVTGSAGSYNYFAEICSGSEAGSYLRLTDFVYHSTLGLRVIHPVLAVTASGISYSQCWQLQPVLAVTASGGGYSQWRQLQAVLEAGCCVGRQASPFAMIEVQGYLAHKKLPPP